MKKRNIITIVVAIAGGAFAVSRLGTGMFGLMSGLNVAVIITIAGWFIGRFLDMREDEKQGFAVKDERTILVEGKAGRISFQMGNYVWLGLIWYEFFAGRFMPWPKFESPSVLLLVLLINLGIYFTALIYYRKRV